MSDYRDFYRGPQGPGHGRPRLHRLEPLPHAWPTWAPQVLAVDSLLPDYGGNLFNLAGYEDKVRINIADVRGHGMEYLVRGPGGAVQPGRAGEPHRLDDRPLHRPGDQLPQPALDPGGGAQAATPSSRSSTRARARSTASPLRLPVDETHLLNPTDVNGINKISGELYHLVYHSVYGIRACSLRLTNTYGPRQLIRHNRQGFIGWFVRQAVLGEEIQLFGDGSQKRDFDYVDDVVDAFLRAGAMRRGRRPGLQPRRRARRSRCSTWRSC